MTLSCSDVAGVILAGGKSSRFGENKAFAVYQERPMVQRAYEALRPLCREIVLVTNTPEQYRAVPARILSDRVPYQGPLGGLATALEEISAPYALAVACDMPLLDAEVLREVARRGRGHLAAIPVQEGRKEYLMALYAKGLAAPMRAALQRGIRSLREFCAGSEDVLWLPLRGNSAANVNTREELEKLERNHAV